MIPPLAKILYNWRQPVRSYNHRESSCDLHGCLHLDPCSTVPRNSVLSKLETSCGWVNRSLSHKTEKAWSDRCKQLLHQGLHYVRYVWQTESWGLVLVAVPPHVTENMTQICSVPQYITHHVEKVKGFIVSYSNLDILLKKGVYLMFCAFSCQWAGLWLFHCVTATSKTFPHFFDFNIYKTTVLNRNSF